MWGRWHSSWTAAPAVLGRTWSGEVQVCGTPGGEPHHASCESRDPSVGKREEMCEGQAYLVHRGADGTPNLVNGTGDKAVDVLVLPEDLWEGGAECRSCLHCRERHFTYRKGMRVELGAVGDT